MSALTTCQSDASRTAIVAGNQAAWVTTLPAGTGYKILT
jgi:hypothetical protein